MHQTYRSDGSDSDGISPLHPYHSRDCRSTSHMIAKLVKVRCFSRGLGVFPNVPKVLEGFFKFIKNRDFSPRMDPKLIFYENL